MITNNIPYFPLSIVKAKWCKHNKLQILDTFDYCCNQQTHEYLITLTIKRKNRVGRKVTIVVNEKDIIRVEGTTYTIFDVYYIAREKLYALRKLSVTRQSRSTTVYPRPKQVQRIDDNRGSTR